MADCNHDCSSCGQDCSERKSPQDFKEQLNPNSTVKHVIAVMSGKGGVGKSMVTSLLASRLNKKGYKTAVLDADITGPSAPKAFGLKGLIGGGTEEGLEPLVTKSGIQMMSINFLLKNETDPVIWRGPVLASCVKQFWGEFIWKDVDYMFVDMPPGTGDIPLTVFQSLPIDGIIVVTSPQDLVGMIVEKAVHMAAMMDIPVYGLVQNMSYFECPDCGKRHYIFGQKNINEVAEQCDVHHTLELPIDPELARFVDEGRIDEYDFKDDEKLLKMIL